MNTPLYASSISEIRVFRTMNVCIRMWLTGGCFVSVGYTPGEDVLTPRAILRLSFWRGIIMLKREMGVRINKS